MKQDKLINKLVYLANEYPEKDIIGISEMFNVSPLDFNYAVWQAQDKGYLTIDEKDGKIIVNSLPEWSFDDDVHFLIDAIPYIFTKLAEREDDMEENYLANWAQGYAGHDLAIALKWLLNDRRLGKYTIKDVSKDEKGKKVVDEYTFYSLFGNYEQQWGRKQFKDSKKLK